MYPYRWDSGVCDIRNITSYRSWYNRSVSDAFPWSEFNNGEFRIRIGNATIVYTVFSRSVTEKYNFQNLEIFVPEKDTIRMPTRSSRGSSLNSITISFTASPRLRTVAFRHPNGQECCFAFDIWTLPITVVQWMTDHLQQSHRLLPGKSIEDVILLEIRK